MIFMSDTPKDKANLAARQAKHSANNAGRAIEGAAEEAVASVKTSSSRALFIQSTIAGAAAMGFALLSGVLSSKAQVLSVREDAAKHDNVTITTRGRKVG